MALLHFFFLLQPNFTSIDQGQILRESSSEWSLSAISASPSMDSLAQVSNIPADTFDIKRNTLSPNSSASGEPAPELRKVDTNNKDSKQDDAEFLKRRSMLKRVSSLFSTK